MSRQHFKIGKGISLTPVSSRPTDPENGDMIYNSTNQVVERYEDGVWVSEKQSSGPSFIMAKTGGDNNGNSGVINFSSTIFDNKGGVSLSGGTYTIQEAGDYYFEVKMEWASPQGIAWLITVDGSSPYSYGDSTATSSYSSTRAFFPNLSVGQVVKAISSTGAIVSMSYFTLNGYKVK